MKRVVRSSPSPLPHPSFVVCHIASHESMTINYNATHPSIVLGQTVRRPTATAKFVSSSSLSRRLGSGSFFVLPVLSCETSRFCSRYLFHIFLVLTFIDSSAIPVVCFLIMLRFVNHMWLLISKPGHYMLLHVAYNGKSCYPPPYTKNFFGWNW